MWINSISMRLFVCDVDDKHTNLACGKIERV